MFFKFLSSLRGNWRVLRREVNTVGAEVELWQYEDLDRDAEEQRTLERIVNGAKLYFSIDRWNTKPNGDLLISIHGGGLVTFLGVKPAFDFAKRRDGSVYYP